MILEYQNIAPTIHQDAYIAPNATVIGKVTIKEKASIWYNVVLRGDDNSIQIGKYTNVQDNSVLHISHKYPTILGDYITVGHNAIVHACFIGNNCLIGMGSIILDGAKIGENTIIGAGAMVTAEKEIPSGVLVLGSPGKVIRKLTEEEIQGIRDSALKYAEYGKDHKGNKEVRK
ncbi:gamma carbonic anhydrase family protein [Isachenkonia alkalipeptolytica]|uniref:Gamma carbonic anhydrase family protein n=1 Tax=Isachenkonia alkalipeptolytica TaxID=2565777 RepID=A0AA44BFX1_9CLOT|nr:gamma carbonic anhydrase family protein [Isachenkonia alkalipeptolytica]NBG88916.1 gamma carbonic anhydrase family protein [Isachenkonia alkalipeptolytica]